MVRDTVLRKIIGSDFFSAPPGSNQIATMSRIFRSFFLLLFFQEPGPQNRESFLFVFLLTAAILASNDFAGWNMQYLNGGIGGVNPLPSRSTRAAYFDSEVFRFYLNIDFFSFWKYGDSRSRRMNSTLGFSQRHPLNYMN